MQVPGLGPETAKRIVMARREARLEDVGLKGKREDKARRHVIFD